MKAFLACSGSLAAITKIFQIPSYLLHCSAESYIDTAWLQPRFKGYLLTQQIKPLPLLVSKQQQRVANTLCCTRQPGALAPRWTSRSPCSKLGTVWVLPTDACSVPYNPDVYPMCNSEVTALHTGKYHWVEAIDLRCLANYSCTINTW